MIDILRRETIYLWYFFSIQFDQIFKYWAVGVIIGSAVSVFGKDSIHRLFGAMRGKRLGVFGIAAASILGVASPLCMYGTVPIAAAFSNKGMRDDWLAAFMMSSILLNPQLIVYSAALGPAVLAVRIISCFFCGIIAGLLVRVFYALRDKSYFDFTKFSGSENRDAGPNPFFRLLKSVWRNVKITGPYFLIGIALSAAFQRYIPESAVVAFFGGSRAFGALMAATIGVPMYVCGGGTIPLLQGWLAGGMSIGSAAAFMITGPATKITNLGAVKIVLGPKGFFIYLVFVIVYAVACGVLVDLV